VACGKVLVVGKKWGVLGDSYTHRESLYNWGTHKISAKLNANVLSA
jgi:hypothetical protein